MVMSQFYLKMNIALIGTPVPMVEVCKSQFYLKMNIALIITQSHLAFFLGSQFYLKMNIALIKCGNAWREGQYVAVLPKNEYRSNLVKSFSKGTTTMSQFYLKMNIALMVSAHCASQRTSVAVLPKNEYRSNIQVKLEVVTKLVAVLPKNEYRSNGNRDGYPCPRKASQFYLKMNIALIQAVGIEVYLLDGRSST